MPAVGKRPCIDVAPHCRRLWLGVFARLCRYRFVNCGRSIEASSAVMPASCAA